MEIRVFHRYVRKCCECPTYWENELDNSRCMNKIIPSNTIYNGPIPEWCPLEIKKETNK